MLSTIFLDTPLAIFIEAMEPDGEAGQDSFQVRLL
ncbi:hypothetical protein FHR87_000113 [Azomonas macrocytogenes]|uniref:Uncharacterized protein n=1 Tax=Azomonas macrocytogenes TaxID=69962 RepID=A0A839T1Y3_AZOMA|nr:hypothetical protein [Azomonas macrocytogenes]